MKKSIGMLAALAILLGAGMPAFSQEAAPDRAVVPLSNPSKAAKIEASVMRGGITVKGYNGKEVIVEARIREKSLSREGEFVAQFMDRAQRARGDYLAQFSDRDRDREQEREKKERSKEGMKLISGMTRTGLVVEEQDNVVTIHTESWKYSIELSIQVPTSSSLQLQSTNDGDIIVENVSGEMEINNTSGMIAITNASGSVIAHTVNGDIEVTLNRVTSGKPLSFTNMNGDIDVTLPAGIKADVKMKSQMGNIYSDFDVVMKPAPQRSKETGAAERGRYRITFDESLYGAINGGGQEITFNTFNGDIFIRKGK